MKLNQTNMKSPKSQQNLSRQSSKNSRVKQEQGSPLLGGCCRGFSNVNTVASTVSTLQQNRLQQRHESLEIKVVFMY